MNYLKIFLSVTILFSLWYCNSSQKPADTITLNQSEEEVILNDMLKEKIGDWAEEGKQCYGVVILTEPNGNVQFGKPVKSMILRIKSDSLRMKSLENINLSEVSGCSKLGISYGQKWWEKEGDLFQTKEEAIAFLDNKGWKKVEEEDGVFKVGQ